MSLNGGFDAGAIAGDLKHTGTNLGVFSVAVAARQTGGANVTNSVTAGGTNDTVADLTVTVGSSVAASGAAVVADVEARLASIRNDIYQLARSVKQDHDALRLYGFLT